MIRYIDTGGLTGMTAEARLLQQARKQASKQARDRSARFEVSSGKEQPWDARRFGKGGARPFVVRGSGRTGAEGKERAMKKGLRGLACLLAPAVLLLGLPAGASAETWTATWTSASSTPWEGTVTNGSVILVAERYSSLYRQWAYSEAHSSKSLSLTFRSCLLIPAAEGHGTLDNIGAVLSERHQRQSKPTEILSAAAFDLA